MRLQQESLNQLEKEQDIKSDYSDDSVTTTEDEGPDQMVLVMVKTALEGIRL